MDMRKHYRAKERRAMVFVCCVSLALFLLVIVGGLSTNQEVMRGLN